jgi:hypothetical protein
MLHYIVVYFLNSRPKLAIFSLALADLLGNKAHRADTTKMKLSRYSCLLRCNSLQAKIHSQLSCSVLFLLALDSFCNIDFGYSKIIGYDTDHLPHSQIRLNDSAVFSAAN